MEINKITDEELIRTSIDYNPETGEFKWKLTRPSEHFSTPSSEKRWYTLFAGKAIDGLTSCGRTKYVVIRVNGRKFKAHRVAWYLVHGEWPQECVDHIDGDGINNKINNLRSVSKLENSRNSRLSKSNTSSVNGVHLRKDTEMYVVRGSKPNGDGGFTRIYLGQYATLVEAESVREAWEDSEGNFSSRHGKAI